MPDDQDVAPVVDVVLPNKAPVRFELAFVPDESGLKLKEVIGVFVYRYPADTFAGGAERGALVVEGESLKVLEDVYNSSLKSFIEKHGTCGVDEAVALLPKRVPLIPE